MTLVQNNNAVLGLVGIPRRLYNKQSGSGTKGGDTARCPTVDTKLSVKRQSNETLKLTLPVLTFSVKLEMVVTLPSLRWSKGISFQTWVVGRQWPKLPCQTVKCFLQKSLALVTLPALQTEITAFGFILANFSMESQVEDYQLLVQTTSTRNLNTPKMYYNATYLNEENHFVYWDKLEKHKTITKLLCVCFVSSQLEQPFKAHLETGHRKFLSEQRSYNMLFPCSNFKFIYTKYNYQGNCMLWRKMQRIFGAFNEEYSSGLRKSCHFSIAFVNQ